MKLMTDEQRRQLIANGTASANDPDFDPFPVVKLFTPDAAGTWLLSELDPDDPDVAFGLCDPGLGFPERGSVRISELRAFRGRFGLPIERDRCFEATKPISAYASEAAKRGRIGA